MDDLRRYAAIASELARRALAGVSHDPAGGDRVAIAAPAARLLLDDDADDVPFLVAGFKRLATIGEQWSIVGVTPGKTTFAQKPVAAGSVETAPRIADAAGHVRDVYHPLVLHLHLAAFAKRYETLPVKAWSACEDALPEAVAPARLIEAYTDSPPPLDRTALVLWEALCLYEQAKLTSRDLDGEITDAVVGAIVRSPGRAGSLHMRADDDSPDAWTYRELTGLHALANLALQTRNRDWARRVEEIAAFHYARTQPDYVTHQPWAVFAFAWPDRTRFFVDQQLHDVQAAAGAGGGSSGGGTDGGLSIMAGLLLADAADAFAAFAG